MPLEDSFLAAIRASPEDDAPRLIYADWLSEQPDEAQAARGEFVRAHVALAGLEEWTPEWHALRQRAIRLGDDFASAWLAPFHALGVSVTQFERGLPSRLKTDAETLTRHASTLAALAPGWNAVHVLGGSAAIAEALDRPLPEGVANVALEYNDRWGVDSSVRENNASVVARSKWLKTARGLSISGAYLGPHAERIVEAASTVDPPRLRELKLKNNGLLPAHAPAVASHSIFRSLAALGLPDNYLDHGLADVLAALDPDALRTLNVGLDGHGASATLAKSPVARTLESLDLGRNYLRDRLAPLFESPTAFPKLRRLRLVRSFADPTDAAFRAPASHEPGVYFGSLRELELRDEALDDAGVAALVDSPFVDRLRSLAVASDKITDAGADAIAHSPRVAALRRLKLEGTQLTPSGAAALRRSPHLRGLLELSV